MRPTPLLCALLALAPATSVHAATVGVGVVHRGEWSPGDAAREGASEFVVLLRVAQLQRESRATGLVAVGDRHGFLLAGGERALRRAALTGVVVARIARDGEATWTPDQLFVAVGNLSEERTHRILTRGLELYGAAPVAVDPEHPTQRELGAIRTHLQKFQALFALESGPQVALR